MGNNRNNEKYFIIITFITSFFGVFITNGVIIGSPAIAAEFGMNNISQNWIPTILVFVVTMFTLPAGQITGKFGFKKSLVIGQAVILIGLLLCCISFDSNFFFISRVLQGIGIAIANVSEMAIIVLAIDKNRRGRALGIIVTGVYLGTSLSPVVCGFLVEHFNWRSMFYITIFFTAISTAIMFIKIKDEWKTNEHDKLDIKGMIIYMFGIFLMIYGITIFMNIYGKIFTAIGLILLAVFGFYELRQKTPAFEVNLFRNHKFTLYNFAGLFGYLAAMAITTILNYHFQYVRDWSAQLTGFILLISPIAMSITAPNAGRLSDRIHPQKIATTGMIISIIAFAILIFMDQSMPIYLIVIAMILQAVGTGLFSSPNMNAIMSSVDEKYAGHASASQLTMRAIGQTVSLSLLTLVFAWVMGSLSIATEHSSLIVQSSQIICIICAIACVLAVIFSLSGLKLENKISN